MVDCIRQGNFEGFESVLAQQPELASCSDKFGRVALHYTAELGDVRFMQYLFDTLKTKPHQASLIDTQSAKGETSLMLAVTQGNKAAAEWLIKKNADLNITAFDSTTALDYAVEAGYTQLVHLLLSHGASPQKAKAYQQIQRQNAVLLQKRMPIEKGNTRLQHVEKLAADPKGSASILKAASEGNVEIIHKALAQGEDLEEPSEDGRTPLMIAASEGHHEAIRTLLAAGANIDATSPKGWTTLMTAVRKKDATTVNLLISHGADVNHLSPDRWTALAEAAYQSQTEIVEMLLKCGADTESRSSHDWTPLMHASYKGDEAAVALILSAGADADVTSGHDETALLLATAGGYTRIVKKLLEMGCAPEPQWAKEPEDGDVTKEANQKTEMNIVQGAVQRAHPQGWTPLMLACQSGHDEIARILLDLDVNTQVKSPHGKCALEIAEENGRLALVPILMHSRNKRGR